MLNVSTLITTCEAVVFDCGDTLLHLDPPRHVIFRDAAAELGFKLELNAVAHAYELVDFALKMRSSKLKTARARADFYSAFNEALCSALGIRKSLPRLHPLLVQRFRERRNWVPYGDATETLRALGQSVPIHVLANWDMGLDDVLRRAGLRELLGDVASSEMLGAEKPERECFMAFLDRNRLRSERVVYVGNEYLADVVGARDAGLMAILIDRDDCLPAADCLRIGTLRDLIPASWGAK